MRERARFRRSSATSDQTGLFYPVVRRGSYVEEGMKIGYVTALSGPRAPFGDRAFRLTVASMAGVSPRLNGN